MFQAGDSVCKEPAVRQTKEEIKNIVGGLSQSLESHGKEVGTYSNVIGQVFFFF